MFGSGGGHPNAVKRCSREQQSLYGQNYEWNVAKVRYIPSCVLSSGIMQRVKTREALPTVEWIGSLYAWFQLRIG